ncbi:aminotransferase [Virgibacillus necropolis]|uniref:Aminotransferase n=1 Tax=Virgibacillus necropolis TaxID=163877 RepID=A0A221MGL4_9BACI|nr:aminotransferase [Virgibacillus necropolis]ASN06803.1 aromatic amino acid aminotransferase [Virgibacillus necropolis]
MSQVSTKRYLSKTAKNIKPSGIRRFFDLANQMEDVISLGVGEPDFVTSWNVCEAAYAAMENGYTAYSANAGLMELREAISGYLTKQFKLRYQPASEIIVTTGASQAIDLAFRALVDPGDEVLIHEPSFVAYAPIVQLAGGIPIPVEASAESAFKLLPQQLEAKITDKTKLVLLCFPNNPTGATLDETELGKIAEVVKKHDLLVLSDEIYAELSYDKAHVSIASIHDMKERTILISGFSKAFAMTGWRLGYLAGPEVFIQAMLKIHQYTMMCAPTIAQHGALEALTNGLEDVTKMVTSYRQRRNFFVKACNQIGLECHKPGGAFYAFPSIHKLGLSSEEFAEELLKEEKVAVVPGSVFGLGGQGHIRCSYAASMDNLQKAIERMDRFLAKRI